MLDHSKYIERVMFSIVIPLYNKELSVERSIRSVLDQTFKDFELIIVNDGSTDRSFSVVSEIDDARIRIHQQENAGVSVARNRGVELAQYKYVAFMDADDEWLPTFLERMVSVITSYPKSTWWGCSYARATSQTREGLAKGAVVRVEPSLIDYFENSVTDLIVHMTSVVVLKARFLELGGFPEGVKFGEDQDLFCRLAERELLPYLNEVLSLYYSDTENRACEGRVVQEMPPFYRSWESKMTKAYDKSLQEFWIREYLVERYLNEVSLCAQTDGARGIGVKWLLLCRRTSLQRPRFLKGCIYMLLPVKCVKWLVGKLTRLK